jgi:hypothetical protein
MTKDEALVQPAPVQSCYCPNCEALSKELAALKAHLTEEKKVELATNWFAEDWAITKAVGMLHDYDRLLWKTTPPAQPAPEVCCGEYKTCLKPCTPRGEFLAARRQWVGLTDDERKKLWRDVIKWGDPSHDDVDLMEAIEAKLKEKNT